MKMTYDVFLIHAFEEALERIGAKERLKQGDPYSEEVLADIQRAADYIYRKFVTGDEE